MRVEDGAVLHADIHAPEATVVLYDSALIGRATAQFLKVADSYVLYDPALDTRTGFFAKQSPLYNEDGAPIPGVLEIIKGFEHAPPAAMSQALLTHVVSYWDAQGWRSVAKASGYSNIAMKRVAVSAFAVERARKELKELEAISVRTGTDVNDVLGTTFTLVEVPE